MTEKELEDTHKNVIRLLETMREIPGEIGLRYLDPNGQVELRTDGNPRANVILAVVLLQGCVEAYDMAAQQSGVSVEAVQQETAALLELGIAVAQVFDKLDHTELNHLIRKGV